MVFEQQTTGYSQKGYGEAESLPTYQPEYVEFLGEVAVTEPENTEKDEATQS